jgi:hypothetical protein
MMKLNAAVGSLAQAGAAKPAPKKKPAMKIAVTTTRKNRFIVSPF